MQEVAASRESSATIKHEHRLSDTQLGLFSGFMFVLGTLAAAMPLGTLAYRRSRKTILAVCIALWSMMTAAWSYGSLLMLRFVVGTAVAGLQPTAMSVVAVEIPP
jgi:predicted MFS family arabinose efflux permease